MFIYIDWNLEIVSISHTFLLSLYVLKDPTEKPPSARIALRLQHPCELEGEDQIIRSLETFLRAQFY